MIVYVGTYTRGTRSQGIYGLRLDLGSGQLSSQGLMARSENPSFLAIAPDRNHLYAVKEVGDFAGQPVGGLCSFEIERRTGRLLPLNVVPSGGEGPCHLVVDATGRYLLAANYGGGSVTVVAIDPAGRLGKTTALIQHQGKGPNPNRQSSPHAHSINLDASNQYAVAADLGTDQLLVYRFDAETGSLQPHDPPAIQLAAGAGPRHFAFHPTGKFAYVINELDSTLTALGYQAGAFEKLQTISTLPDGQAVPGNSTAEIVVHPSGKFVYGSNRGHDSIAVYSVDAGSGQLTLVQHVATGGKTPRNFALDPSGRYLLAANQGSNSIVVFQVDAETGRLEATGQSVEVPAPVCLRMMPLATSPARTLREEGAGA